MFDFIKKVYYGCQYITACVRGGKGSPWFSLPLTEGEYSSVCEWINITNQHNGFAPLSIIKMDNNTVVALCHGNPDGNVLIGKETMSLETLLYGLISEDLIGHNVKRVLTLSCFGRNQKIAKVNGVTIQSMHQTGSEIYVIPVTDKDGKKYVNFNINPDTVGAILRGE